MIPRALLERVFADAIAAHHVALRPAILGALERSGHADRARFGLAVGKAALAMARGLGAVQRGYAISPHCDNLPLPVGWQLVVSSHPVVDERALVAADAAIELVDRAPADAVIVALISGGASALMELPLVPLPVFVRIIGSLARLGVPIAALNDVRCALSMIKGGQLALRAAAPIVTLAVSDVTGDAIETVGSGPTVGAWLDAPANPFAYSGRRGQVRRAAMALLKRHDIPIPVDLSTPVDALPVQRPIDFASVIVPMNRFARRISARIPLSLRPSLQRDPIVVDVEAGAAQLARVRGTQIAWGEPTLVVPPDHGEGGRMQQLALAIANQLSGTERCAFAVGTDGIDGPPPEGRPAPAGAFVDGSTWDAIRAAGIDPQAALDRCDAGTALEAVGALVITGPTGINHADLVVVG